MATLVSSIITTNPTHYIPRGHSTSLLHHDMAESCDPSTEAKPNLKHTISSQFCSDDADLTFLSSDNVVFKIHRKNLDVTCGLFPPTEFKNDPVDLVAMSEDSETLEQLFAFIYPKRHPELIDVSFLLLKKIAEAAEKYEVFAAMNICKTRMRERVAQSPLDVFVYSYKHGYHDLCKAAVPLLNNIPLTTMVKKLPHGLIVPWVEYHEEWRKNVTETFFNGSHLTTPSTAASTQHHLSDSALIAVMPASTQHHLSDSALIAVMRRVLRSTNGISLDTIQAAVHEVLDLGLRKESVGKKSSYSLNNYGLGVDDASHFIQVLENNLAKMPTFDTYLNISK